MNKKIITIMVVEDEPLLLKAIAAKMVVVGINAILCPSGSLALKKLKALTDLPDAIWLDYYLRDMNGLEFCQKIKKDKKFQNIPILVVSNSASPDKVQSMLALGVNDYLLKAEHRLDDIINIIKKLLGKP